MAKAMYQFRVNGEIMPYIRVVGQAIGGVSVGKRRIEVEDYNLGWVALDDNENLADPALPRFIIEFRDISIPPHERRLLPSLGWKQITTREMLALLESVGLIASE